MNTPQPPNPELQAFHRIFATIALSLVGAIALCAFTLSFTQQRTLALASGIPPFLSWIIPVIIDLSIVAFTATAAIKKIRGERAQWQITLVTATTLASLFFNVYLAPRDFTCSIPHPPFLPDYIPPIIVTIAIHAMAPLFLFAMTETAALSLKLFLPVSQIQGGHLGETSANSCPAQSQSPSISKANNIRINNAKARKTAAKELRDNGATTTQIAEQLGISDRQARRLLNDDSSESPS